MDAWVEGSQGTETGRTAEESPLRLLGAPALELAYGKRDKLRVNVDGTDLTLGADDPDPPKA